MRILCCGTFCDAHVLAYTLRFPKSAAPFDHGRSYVANAWMHESDRIHINILILMSASILDK